MYHEKKYERPIVAACKKKLENIREACEGIFLKYQYNITAICCQLIKRKERSVGENIIKYYNI